MSQPVNLQDDEQDKQQIRALIDRWCEASAAADLTAQFNIMTEDVVFLTPGRAPMRREEFAVCWNLLEVSFTPIEGGETRKHAGNVLTVLRRGADGQWRIWRDANLLTPA
jgi:ketosteroid isomerase-like protein